MNNLNNKISAGTIARTACLLLALTNQILSACGKTVAALIAWWKNNSFTTAALEADKTYDRLKSQIGK